MTTADDDLPSTVPPTDRAHHTLTRRRVLGLAAGAVLAAACSDSSSGSDTTAGSSPTPTAPPTTLPATTSSSTNPPVAATTTTLPPPVQPLTGLPLTDPALLSRVALVVKVSNDPGARPQTGLNDADIVFEAWGAGPTRFATVFHSHDVDFVGPIRSCREQDVNLVGSFNRAVFACSGGNPGNLELLRSSDMLLVTEGRGPGWELDPARKRPHKTHANTELLRSNAGADRTGPAQQFQYRAVGEAAGAGDVMAGFDLQIQQVSAQWRWDAAAGSYVRSQEGRPHLLSDGARVTTDNVVVIWLDYAPSSTDGRSPDGRTTGTNPVVVFTGGRMVDGTWTRPDRLAPFALTDASGAAIRLTPGRTFIELANSGNGSFAGNDELTPVA